MRSGYVLVRDLEMLDICFSSLHLRQRRSKHPCQHRGRSGALQSAEVKKAGRGKLGYVYLDLYRRTANNHGEPANRKVRAGKTHPVLGNVTIFLVLFLFFVGRVRPMQSCKR